jgi:hypothetical protein
MDVINRTFAGGSRSGLGRILTLFRRNVEEFYTFFSDFSAATGLI